VAQLEINSVEKAVYRFSDYFSELFCVARVINAKQFKALPISKIRESAPLYRL